MTHPTARDAPCGFGSVTSQSPLARRATLVDVPDIREAMGQADDHPDRARFAVLFDAHHRRLLGYALRRLDDPEDAADVVAETFLVAWRRLDDVPSGDGARPWLLGVARRVLANQRRSARRHVGLADRLGRELATQVAHVHDASVGDLQVRRALTGLSDDDRQVLLLAGWEGLTPAEIGVVIGVSGVTARSRLHRARRRLRAELDALEHDPGRTSTLDLAKEHTR
jgi:RNA polymerase sigma factor (sigma-70 family)